MKECILATDLALFFGNKAKLKDLVDKGTFSWEDQEHRYVYGVHLLSFIELASYSERMSWPVAQELRL